MIRPVFIRTIRTLFFLLTVLFTLSVQAEAVSVGLECSVNGAGRTQIQILQASEFAVYYPRAIKTIYTCGPFVNDGTVDTTYATIIELVPNSCDHFKYGGMTQIIYCH